MHKRWIYKALVIERKGGYEGDWARNGRVGERRLRINFIRYEMQLVICTKSDERSQCLGRLLEWLTIAQSQAKPKTNITSSERVVGADMMISDARLGFSFGYKTYFEISRAFTVIPSYFALQRAASRAFAFTLGLNRSSRSEYPFYVPIRHANHTGIASVQ